MNYLKDLFYIYDFEIMLIMSITIVVLLVFNIVNRIKISKTLKKYNEVNKILSVGDSDNIEDTLINYVKELNFIKNSLSRVELECEDISQKVTKSIQQIGFIRYTAFDDIGGELSFSIAMLDSNSDGFVMSNIYARDMSHMYAKPIRGGKSIHKLSSEEKEAIVRAMSLAEYATK